MGAQFMHLPFSLCSEAQGLGRAGKPPVLGALDSETGLCQPVPGFPVVAGLLAEQLAGLCIHEALSRYCLQVLPGGTLVPGAGRVPDACFPTCGLQTTPIVSPVQMLCALGGCALPLQP